ncbi:HPP family protein [Streptomyces beihaiensis]|uniref:HPP family protein n=1 Tax=Streptomyces beihaiensis TaxID=2984495 RepID=A0ABT3U147_9ACTN|nr:HPP family protein [Streptomyces beihaiensis]MCX3063041.1 HPP family protein [Streptomyces beihaiensis]
MAREPLRARAVAGARLFLLAAPLLAAVGALGLLIDWVLLTTTVGPTAYLLLAHPDTLPARLRGAVLGHGCAVVVGLACLAAFGLWTHASTSSLRHESARQLGAQAVAVGLTLFFLHLVDAHHPPAAATALLITSGLARPGPALYGMLTGLALVIAVAPVLTAAFPSRSDKGGG